ncbi:thiamine pyrophosphate-binding protein [Mesorhizobium sp. AD1-1]|uniref:thiamine pyrophosphate-binding protein n=1 Tax=Mesorhizobium sp. AD1-1 TaxID=2876621 RepID=UPI001CCF0A87|nr:thiamine pyrophosphate-binding protein [Mesorhizobium sp. AD1-1]MBZ9719207.1 thiamine pyrophosphate-binding protein [Mesorhizobium sp. AD1-1]
MSKADFQHHRASRMNSPDALTPRRLRTGGKAVAEAFRIHGVERIFCVPGESYLPILDALVDEPGIQVVSCRHESGAANMAEAYGKLTGRPGVLMVTRGPGACNATIGLHTAFQDSTPLVAIVGDVDRSFEDREAFQEIDFRAFLKPVCKWVGRIQSADRIPELLSRAFYLATSGRPGPVALVVPEDMLAGLTDAAAAPPYRVVQPAPSAASMDRLRELLRLSSKPVMLVGGGGWTPDTSELLRAFAERQHLPVAGTFRCQDRIDNRSDAYVGHVGIGINPRLADRIREADLILAVGARLGEKTTQHYDLLIPPCPAQTLVHVHPDPSEIGRVYAPALGICSSVGEFASLASALPVSKGRGHGWMRGLRSDYLAHLAPIAPPPGTSLDMWEIMRELRERLDPHAILTTDAGSFSGWMQRFYVYRTYPSQLGATNGAMGYGIPAAIAAKLIFPEKTVVAFCGDGGALMTGNEIATAVKYDIAPIILVLNNDMYGSIRVHQERDYPGRGVDTGLVNPCFVRWAESFGAFAATVERTEDFAPAFEQAAAAGRVAVIEIRLPADAGPPGSTISQIRSEALAKQAGVGATAQSRT